MSHKHTPGPWTAVESNCGGGMNIHAANGALVAHTMEVAAYAQGGPISSDAAKANAYLAAAAPELLEVLQAFVNVADSCPHTSVGHLVEHGAATNRARAVIAKATSHEQNHV